MPNWVITKIYMKGRDISYRITKYFGVKDSELILDFDKIIPMPKELDITYGSDLLNSMSYILNCEQELIGATQEQLQNLYLKNTNLIIENQEELKELKKWFAIDNERKIELGLKGLRNIINYGCSTWYEWRKANWGTKWNSCEFSYLKANDNECELTFETAWNCPFKVIQKLYDIFEDTEIKCEYADEDIGSNTGFITRLGNNVVVCENKDMSKKAYETYIELWGMPEDLVFNKEIDNYEWL